MGKLFGTDGIRGVVPSELDADLAFRVGRAAAAMLLETAHKKPVVLIGKDTRLSGDMLEAALAAGICSTGADAVLLGVIPTPAVAFATTASGADAGVVISASHNPAEYNGIKIFNSRGYKLDDELEERVEALIASGEIPPCPPENIGRVFRDEGMHVDYIRHISEAAPGGLSGLRIAVDCSNGAASATAKELFSGLGAAADFFFDKPDGLNINAGCGSTHLDALRRIVLSGGYDAGVAFDGDADRCLIIDELGHIVDGDKIIAVCAADMKNRGALKNDSVVVTVLSNLGFFAYCRERGICVDVSGVGDRLVLEEMLRKGHVLGGEQSGHVIFLDRATTGDGQLTAAAFLSVLKRSGKSVSELSRGYVLYPQVMKNVRVPNALKATIAKHEAVAAELEKETAHMGGDGRILLRPSGTEALVRVMVEGKDEEMVEAIATRLADLIGKTAAAE